MKPSSPTAKLYMNESLTFANSSIARECRIAVRAFNAIYAEGEQNRNKLNKVVTSVGLVYIIDQGGNFHLIRRKKDIKLKADLSSDVLFKW